jgi:hypothetical protein
VRVRGPDDELSDDERCRRFLAAWDCEPAPLPESSGREEAGRVLKAAGHTIDAVAAATYGEGWTAWNGASPEKEFCDFVVAFVALVRPSRVIETGIGQGYVTRRLALEPSGSYVGYESDDELRGWLRELDMWTEGFELAPEPEPSATNFATCDLAVLDSAPTYRKREIDLWRTHAPPGSYVLVHDARPDHPVRDGVWTELADHVAGGGDGVFLSNPRGSWLCRKPLDP